MACIQVKIQDFNSDINDCLEQSFNDGSHNEGDPFHNRSSYIVITSNEEIAALGRITKGPDGFFFRATHGSNNFVNTSDSVDLGRCLVTPNYRGYIYYDLLICYSFHILNESSHKYVNGTSLVGKRMVDRLLSYGFSKQGKPIPFKDANGNCRLIQAFTSDLEATKTVWMKMLIGLKEKIISDGHTIVEDYSNYAAPAFLNSKTQ